MAGAFVPEPSLRALAIYSALGVVVACGLGVVFTTYRFAQQDGDERAAGYTTTNRGWFYKRYWQLDPITGAVVRPPEEPDDT